MNTHSFSYKERLLTVDNITLKYGKKTIFRDVNLHIDNVTRPGISQGQVVSLLGPSGIGKTQLFRCLSGLQKPTTGQILINDVKTQVKAGEVGVVFQSYPLFQHRTIWSNLKIAATQNGKKDEEITNLLNEFGLLDKKNLYPGELSGGQQQRVAIIQQLLCSTHFLLMDEPFSGLDVIMKKKAMDMILKVSQQDELNTIVVTTHDISTAISISDTIWVLGRQKAVDGSWVEGSTVIKCFDLIERDLAWHDNVEKHPNFYPLVLEINELFKQI
jgi:ABC-type nitrate/sulfonate/bicarbonate transport system ATPase subunit